MTGPYSEQERHEQLNDEVNKILDALCRPLGSIGTEGAMLETCGSAGLGVPSR
jgi:hypothetical protein